MTGGRRALWSGLIAVAATLVAALACLPEKAVLGGLTDAVTDLQFRLRPALVPLAPITIVELDEAALSRLGGFPLDRAVLAALIDRLDEGGAALIVPDILLAQSRQASPAANAALAAAIEASGRVLLPFAFTYGAGAGATDLPPQIVASAFAATIEGPGASAAQPHPSGVVLPDAAFLGASGFGHVNVVRDAAGGVRSVEAAIRFGDLRYPFLPVSVAARSLGLQRAQVVLAVGRSIDLGARSVALDSRDRLLVNQYGPGVFRRIDGAGLLDGTVAADEVAGRIVFISVSAAGAGDQFSNAFARGLPGTDLIATVTDNLLTGRTLSRPAWSDAAALAAALVLGFCPVFLILSGRVAMGLAVAAAGVVAWLAGAQYLFAHRLVVVETVLPVLAGLLAAGPALLVPARAARRRRARELGAAQARAGYAPALAGLAEGLGEPGATRTIMCAVVFADVRGFTGQAAERAPEAVHALMRATVGGLADAAARHRGAVAKTLGDGAMIVFGATAPGPDTGADAVAFIRELASPAPSDDGDADMRPDIRFGAHYGPVTIGLVEVGAAREVDIAGDTVNVASRLQGLTRRHEAAALISDQLAEAATAAGGAAAVAGFRRLPRTRLRGRERPIGIHALPLAGDAGS